jgi:putative oxygen-independent coproporphyrinogen III oxidase
MKDFHPAYPEDREPIGIYIHIPFCIGRCYYCAFPTNSPDPKLEADYIEAVIREIDLRQETTRFRYQVPNRLVDTIYLGGGTPSLLRPELLAQLLDSCRSAFHLVRQPEITFEINPATSSVPDLENLRASGINRASLGIQSLNDKELEKMGRSHTSTDAMVAFEDLRKAGFTNVSVDLIAGYPGQNRDSVEETLTKALSLHPEHVSVYLLELKAGTRLESLVKAGELPPPDNDLAADLYQDFCSITTAAGYRHYEISNFSLGGLASRHNLKYWEDCIYIGLGAGAHGMTGRHRYANLESLPDYIKAVESGRLPISNHDDLTAETRFKDAMIMGLRLVEGVDLVKLGERYLVDAGAFLEDTIGDLADAGLYQYRGDRIVLTAKGRLLSNVIFSRWV